jgi:hypothetical protein
MKLIVNEGFVKKRTRIAQYASWGGMMALVLALVASFRVKPDNPQYRDWLIFSFVMLMVGMLAANVGAYNMRRFVRKPRPEQVIASALKTMDSKYQLFAWYLPSPYVLLTPAGLYVFVVRDVDGKVNNENGKWKRPFKWTRLLNIFGSESVGKPDKEALEEKETMEKFLAEKLPDEDVPVRPLILFTNPRVDLDAGKSPVPVVTPKKLKSLIRADLKSGRPLPQSLQKRLRGILEGV